jgi:hypothetical protein
MPTTIENMKNLFTEDEKKTFGFMRAKTMLAVDAFKVDKAQGSSQAFFDAKSAYSRDSYCKMNFATLSVIISELTEGAGMSASDKLDATLASVLNELNEAFAVFIKSDNNSVRKATYENVDELSLYAMKK